MSDLLIDVLRQIEVDAAFGVVSVHNLPLVDAIDRELRWVPTRGEAGAVNAADGYARVRDGFGCAVTSTGTGAANAAGAMVEALTAGSLVLHVTGQIESEHLGQGRGVIHETRDQLGMLRSVSKWAATVGPEMASRLFLAAVVEAKTLPTGPVSIEWPIDLQYTESGHIEMVVPVPSPSEGDLDLAVELINEAERPLVWAGGGARHAPLELRILVEQLGAGLLTSNAGRGVLPEDHPQVIGNYAAAPACGPLLAEADLLISIGTHFRSNETRTYGIALPTPHVQIDVDPAALDRAMPCDLGITGDARAVLDALLPELHERPGWIDRVAEVAAACRAGLVGNIGPYAEICAAMNDVLPARAPRVRDITIPNSAWGNRMLTIHDFHTNINPRGGGIGQALAMGVGASIARPDQPTMVLIGDGGLQVQVGELATVAEEQLPITVVVFDDGGYGVLRNTQDAFVGRRSGVDLFTPDMGLLAAAHDLDHRDVTSADTFRNEFVAAVESGRSNILRVDCEAVGPMPKPFTPPVTVPEAR